MGVMSISRKIVIIGSSRFPIAEPFAGGLEAHVWQLARSLSERGHDVTLFAAPGSDPLVARRELDVRNVQLTAAGRHDMVRAPGISIEEHHAYLSVMLELADPKVESFDLVHNHSLHYLPVAMARTLPMPMLTTLHTPPTAWLESAVQFDPAQDLNLVAVSEFTAAQWRSSETSVGVVPNGVDLDLWPVGPGGDSLIWSGRLVPEKGPHLAIAAARRVGMSIRVAGPIGDRAYFDEFIRPTLDSQVSYLGHLDHAALAVEVGRSAATLVTPMWEEPFGLVVAESLACGTPVAAFRRGGIPEVLDDSCGRLAEPDDVAHLAELIVEAVGLSRADCRRRAESHCSIERMADRYEALYSDLIGANG
ncbi:MAG: glycosyl transferase family 1 [Pseudonocardiales bacterium]|nr:glycosyl transferase family 1 [Pseudonocardiales bacterium]